MESEKTDVQPEEITMTPEQFEKYQKMLQYEDKKNAYNREYMRKLRMNKEKVNKIQREYRMRKKNKENTS